MNVLSIGLSTVLDHFFKGLITWFAREIYLYGTSLPRLVQALLEWRAGYALKVFAVKQTRHLVRHRKLSAK